MTIETSAILHGKTAVHLGLFSTSTGNPLIIVDDIRQLLPNIQKTLSLGVKVELVFETSHFIQASINKVTKILLESLIS
uniref:efflux RND transporter permease subunit n=1 Tax=Xenorhabdus sp. TH1 TaxID=3130166 RepID=UPI0040403E5D